MEANILERIDRKVDSIIKNQVISDQKFDRLLMMEKRIRENEIALGLLKKYNESHSIKHWIIYALIALLFVLTAASWMLR